MGYIIDMIDGCKKTNETIASEIETCSFLLNTNGGINGPDYYKIEKEIRKFQNDTEYLAINARYLARSMPSENAQSNSERVTADAALAFGYGGELTDLEKWLRFALPPILSKRQYKKRGNIECFRGMIFCILDRFWKEDVKANGTREYMSDCVVVFKHVANPKEKTRDYDNLETKVVLDAISTLFLVDDSMKYIDLYECSCPGDESFLAVYLVPRDRFADWFITYRNKPENLLK